MYLTRTWVFAVHRQKQKLLGRWPESAVSKNRTPTPYIDLDKQVTQDVQQNNLTDYNLYQNFDNTASQLSNNFTNTFLFTGTTSDPANSTQDVGMSSMQLHFQDKPPVSATLVYCGHPIRAYRGAWSVSTRWSVGPVWCCPVLHAVMSNGHSILSKPSLLSCFPIINNYYSFYQS